MSRAGALADRPWIRPAAIAAALALAATASVLPVWVARLFAPQYPKGLEIRAYGTRLEGDVREINGLNHYIGMRPLETSAIPELGLWPLAIAAAIALILVAALVRGRAGRAALLGLWAIPLGALADIQRWLYAFGHDLSPDAPLRVGPFTPLVVGPTAVWNFRVLAWPGGAVLALLVAAALVTALRRLPRSGAGRHHARAALAAALTLSLATLVLGNTAAASPPALQPLVDRMGAGSELVVPAGTYRGPVVVDRPIAIRAAGEVVLDGGGAGTVLLVRASGARVEGLHVRGSGGQIEDAAAIAVDGADEVTLERVRVSDSYTGIRARSARGLRIRQATVSGSAGATYDSGIAGAHGASSKGDGIALWDVTGALIQDARIDGVRDGVYLSYASDVLIERTRIAGGRYGVHAMFGSDLTLLESELRGNASGLVLMYTAHVSVLRSRMEGHRSAATGYGILLKDARDARLVDNDLIGNAVGLKVEGLEGRSPEAMRNVIAFNVVGVELSPRSPLVLSANTFEGDLVPVEIAGTRSQASWTSHGVGNHWAGSVVVDVDGDGRSELPHAVATAADRATAATPELRALRGTMAYRVFERARRWVAGADRLVVLDGAPLAAPVRVPVPRGDPPATAPLAAAALGVVTALGSLLRWAAA